MNQQETLKENLLQRIAEVKRNLLVNDEARKTAWQERMKAYEKEARECDEFECSRPEWEIRRESESEMWHEMQECIYFEESQQELLIEAASPLFEQLQTVYERKIVEYDGDRATAIEDAVIGVLGANDILGEMIIDIANESVDSPHIACSSTVARVAIDCWAQQQVSEWACQYET